VSPAARLRQIRLNLERWRSLPRDWALQRIEVNVPAAAATLYEDGTPVLTMRAIVGAAEHPTPVLRARLQSVLFNPPWRVPSSIIEKEIKPALKRDRFYLKRNDYAYVDVDGVKELQQLPGPKNALGKIKFEMPNPDDIYLHDTPSRTLFERGQRALSHGCVRLEEPRALAFELLGASAEGDAAIDQAISTGGTQRLALPHTLPVYIFYATAFVGADGAVEFRDDIYGRDRRLADALAARDAADRIAIAAHIGGKG
jgi:murein L,D-transpeptidase YcbB/YkuD